MSSSLIRKLCLCLVFIAGVLSIMATSPALPDIYFSEVNVRPSWRCPGKDVTFDWILNEPAPVSVTVDGREYLMDAETNNLTVAARSFDRTNSPVDAILQVDTFEFDYWPRYEITTLTDRQTIERPAFHRRYDKSVMHSNDPKAESARAFRINGYRVYSRDSWDERIRILGIRVEQKRKFMCANSDGSPLAWEVSPPSGPSFMLRAEDDYSVSLDPKLSPNGTWLFHPKGGECQLPILGFEPKLSIHFTVQCVGADNSS